MSHTVATGRTVRHSKTTYPAGSDCSDLPKDVLAEMVADGAVIEDKPAPAPPKPTSKGPKVVEVGK